jgi:type II secretory pathway pseudopilin PulG
MSIGTLGWGLEHSDPDADTHPVRLRPKTVSLPKAASGESGSALIELLLAMVMLNIAIFALIATFQTGSVALRRASVASNGGAVGDKVMEAYRGLQNKAIYLNAPAGTGGSDVSGMPNGIPNGTSTWYAAYSANTSSFGGTYFNYTTPASSPLWVWRSSTGVGTTGAGYAPIPDSTTSAAASAAAALPAGLGVDPTKAVQKVVGPDGQSYTVFAYIFMVKPSASAGYMKQVTIMVFDPQNSTRVISRQSSFFDPNIAP